MALPHGMLAKLVESKFPPEHKFHGLAKQMLSQAKNAEAGTALVPLGPAGIDAAAATRLEAIASRAESRAASAMQECQRVSSELSEVRAQHAQLASALEENTKLLNEIMAHVTQSNSN